MKGLTKENFKVEQDKRLTRRMETYASKTKSAVVVKSIIEVILIKAKQNKNDSKEKEMGGRKSRRRDAEWAERHR